MAVKRFTQISECGISDLSRLAPMIFSVLPEYYRLFCGNDTEAFEVIVRQMKIFSELNTGFVAFEEDIAAGVLCCYPSTEWETRITAGLLRTLAADRRDAALPALRQYAGSVAPLLKPGLYISRLVVASASRGRGWGRALLAEAESAAQAGKHGRMTLHLQRDNRSARAFYEACGFHLLRAGEEIYQIMEKELP